MWLSKADSELPINIHGFQNPICTCIQIQRSIKLSKTNSFLYGTLNKCTDVKNPIQTCSKRSVNVHLSRIRFVPVGNAREHIWLSKIWFLPVGNALEHGTAAKNPIWVYSNLLMYVSGLQEPICGYSNPRTTANSGQYEHPK